MVDVALMLDTPDDQDVQKGDLQQAQISWCVSSPYISFSSSVDKIVESRFFTLAHELAHNLIKQHNSEHEFWFAAICEARLCVCTAVEAYPSLINTTMHVFWIYYHLYDTVPLSHRLSHVL